MEHETLLVPYCKPIDFDAVLGVCNAVFYGPAPTVIPPMSVADALVFAGGIGTLWAIGFVIKQARKPANY